MHFTASGGQVDAMKLLESNGVRSDLKDVNEKTLAQLLEEYRPEHSLVALENHNLIFIKPLVCMLVPRD